MGSLPGQDWRMLADFCSHFLLLWIAPGSPRHPNATTRHLGFQKVKIHGVGPSIRNSWTPKLALTTCYREDFHLSQRSFWETLPGIFPPEEPRRLSFSSALSR